MLKCVSGHSKRVISINSCTVGGSFSREVVSESPEASREVVSELPEASRDSKTSREASGDLNDDRQRPLATLKRLRGRSFPRLMSDNNNKFTKR